MFHDCRNHEAAELLIVEGRSAADAVNIVRNKQYQAVFALQGKIPNCTTPSGLRRALGNVHVKALLTHIQSGRFSKILILCDADADGLHAGFLLEVFFRVHLPDMVGHRRVMRIYPPLFQWWNVESSEAQYGWSKADCPQDGHQAGDITYFKGIAAMSADTLANACVNADTRIVRVLMPAIGER